MRSMLPASVRRTHITEEGTLVINAIDSPKPYCEIVPRNGAICFYRYFDRRGPEVLEMSLVERTSIANSQCVLIFSTRGARLLVRMLPIIIATATRAANKLDRSAIS
jgi:hypothetical protein